MPVRVPGRSPTEGDHVAWEQLVAWLRRSRPTSSVSARPAVHRAGPRVVAARVKRNVHRRRPGRTIHAVGVVVEVGHDLGSAVVPLVRPTALHLKQSEVKLLPGLGVVVVIRTRLWVFGSAALVPEHQVVIGVVHDLEGTGVGGRVSSGGPAPPALKTRPTAFAKTLACNTCFADRFMVFLLARRSLGMNCIQDRAGSCPMLEIRCGATPATGRETPRSWYDDGTEESFDENHGRYAWRRKRPVGGRRVLSPWPAVSAAPELPWRWRGPSRLSSWTTASAGRVGDSKSRGPHMHSEPASQPTSALAPE